MVLSDLSLIPRQVEDPNTGYEYDHNSPIGGTIAMAPNPKTAAAIEAATGLSVTVDEKAGTITVTGQIDPTKSQSEKSILLISTRGTMPTSATYKGHPVSANVNITIPNPDYKKGAVVSK